MSRECKAPDDHGPASTSGRGGRGWHQRERDRELAVAADRAARSLRPEVRDEYRRMLPVFEDFLQARSFGRLVKLAKDKANLPIAAFAEEIVEALRGNQAVVLAGDTGCGKSTQVPQYLLRAGFRNMCCTQPRRISAIALARRVSFETLNEHGAEVAFKIRFDSSRGQATRILFLTEGVLLRELASDPDLTRCARCSSARAGDSAPVAAPTFLWVIAEEGLRRLTGEGRLNPPIRYDVVIVDEAHERHVTTDLLLGLLRGALERRPTLRVLCMSATIDVVKFSKYLGNAPIIQVGAPRP